MNENNENSLLFVSKKSGKSSDKSGAGSSLSASISAAASRVKSKDVKKRWMYVGLGVVAVVVASSTLLSNKERQYIERQAPSTTVSVTPPNADKAAFEAQYSQDLELFRTQLAKLTRDNDALASKLQQTQDELRNQTKSGTNTPPDGIVPPPTLGGNNSGGLGSLGPVVPPPPPFAPTSPPSIPGGYQGMSELGSGMIPPSPPGFQEPVGEPIVFELASTKNRDGELPDSEARTQFKANPNAGLIPAGSFAPVVLLNGLDAGTSAATQSNPMPVLMTITDQATLPGSARYQLKSCFVLGNGYGELSAERVYVRFNRISCIDKKDRLVLSQEVAGYLVDSDGKLGLRGKVVDRQGARLGKSVIAGFAQGLTGALGQSQSTVTSNLSTGATTSSITGGAALRASGLSGAQAATQQIAEFYLREAQSIFPIITVDNGRKGTIVFSNSAPLKWGNGDDKFIKEVTPL